MPVHHSNDPATWLHNPMAVAWPALTNTNPRDKRAGYADRFEARKKQGSKCKPLINHKLHKGPSHPPSKETMSHDEFLVAMKKGDIGTWYPAKN